MKTLFSKLFFCTLSFFFITISCTNDDSVINQISQGETAQISTKVMPGFHWRCAKCGLLNAGWKNTCSSSTCREEYSAQHGDYLMSFVKLFETVVKVTSDLPQGFQDNNHPIELPNNLFVPHLPKAWYESSIAFKYYNDFKRSTNFYISPPEYIEGFEFGWYRTVRTLYPEYHNNLQVERTHTRYILNYGRLFIGQNGSGIKDGMELAVKAFLAY